MFYWLLGLSILVLYFVWDIYKRRKLVLHISKKAVFITGCDTGFGNSLAKRLDTLGCLVFAGCLTQKGAEELAQASSQRIKPILLDVTKVETIKNACDYVTKHLPEKESGLWAIVNNAGVWGTHAPIALLTKEDINFPFNVNFFGSVDVTRTFLSMIKKGRGRIVNVSSVCGLVTLQQNMPYCASKYAMESFSDALRRELLPFGVKVGIVEPGPYMTPLYDTTSRALHRLWDGASSELKEEYGEDFLFKEQKALDWFMSLCPRDYHAVVEAQVHAVLAVHPRKRYVVGIGAKISFVLSMGPACILDFLLTNFMHNTTPAKLR